MTRLSTAVTNPARTTAQGGAGWLIVETLEAFEVYDFTDRQYGLAVFILAGAVSFVQNVGENRGWWKALGRRVPPVTAPVVDHVDEDHSL